MKDFLTENCNETSDEEKQNLSDSSKETSETVSETCENTESVGNREFLDYQCVIDNLEKTKEESNEIPSLKDDEITLSSDCIEENTQEPESTENVCETYLTGEDELTASKENPEQTDDISVVENPENVQSDISGTEGDQAADSDTELSDEPVPQVKILEAPAPIPTWTFASQAEKERNAEKKNSRKGALIYAAVVTVLFVVCFAVLAVMLIKGYNGNGVSIGKMYGDKTVYIRQDDGTSGLLTVSEIASKVRPSSVGILVTKTETTGEGSGIVMTDDGYVITNYHVVNNAVSVVVLFEDGTQFPATYIGGDEMSDVALLKIEAGDYKLYPAEFGDSDSLLVGEQVVAIGNPAGHEYFGTVTVGYLSAINRNVKFYDDNGLVEKKMTLLQTDAALNPGNSGGALCDMYGKVIGINTMKLASSYVGINFAIPITGALKILEEIKETGKYTGSGDVAEKGVSLGISCYDVIKGDKFQVSETEYFTCETDGILVAQFINEDASAYGILQIKDIITEINGVTVKNATELKAVLDKCHQGDTINLKVYRGTSYVTVSIKLK